MTQQELIKQAKKVYSLVLKFQNAFSVDTDEENNFKVFARKRDFTPEQLAMPHLFTFEMNYTNAICTYVYKNKEYGICITEENIYFTNPKDSMEFIENFQNFYNSLFDWIGNYEAKRLDKPNPDHSAQKAFDDFFNFLDTQDETIYLPERAEDWTQEIIDKVKDDYRFNININIPNRIWEVSNKDGRIIRYEDHRHGEYSLQMIVNGEMFCIRNNQYWQLVRNTENPIKPVSFKFIKKKFNQLKDSLNL